jgi:hypothetical protein
MLVGRCSNTIREECNTKEAKNKLKYKKCNYRNSANVEHEVLYHKVISKATGKVTKGQKVCANDTRTTFSSRCRNMARNKESVTT